MASERIFRAKEILDSGPTDAVPSIVTKDPHVYLKDRLAACRNLAEGISDPKIVLAPEFDKYISIVVKGLLRGCNDTDSDVRMVADESLNRVINALIHSRKARLQFELYVAIKNDQLPVRSLRVALVKFADLCTLTKPSKCRPFVKGLMGPLRKICERTDDPSLQQTLAPAMEKICRTFGLYFSSDNIVALLEVGLINLNNTSSIIRRTAGIIIGAVCQFSRAPEAFVPHLLVDLLQMAPNANEDVDLLLGVFFCVSQVLDVIITRENAKIINFEKTTSSEDDPSVHVSLVAFLNVIRDVLTHENTNVVTSSLEALLRLLKCYSENLGFLFVAEDAFPLVVQLFEFLFPFDTTKKIRVSIKSLAMACLGHIYAGFPQLYEMTILIEDKSFSGVDLFEMYFDHEDPILRGNICLIAGQVLQNGIFYDDNVQKKLVDVIISGLNDSSSTAQKIAASGAVACISNVLTYHGSQGFVLLESLVNVLMKAGYWLVHVEILSAIEQVDFTLVKAIDNQLQSSRNHFDIQKMTLEAVMDCLDNPEVKVREQASSTLVTLCSTLFFQKEWASNLDANSMLALREKEKLLSFGLDPDDVLIKNVSRIFEMLIKKLYSSSIGTSFDVFNEDVPCTVKVRSHGVYGVFTAFIAFCKAYGDHNEDSIINNELCHKPTILKCLFGYMSDIVSFALDAVSTTEICSDVILHPLILSALAMLCKETPSLQRFPQSQRFLDHLLCLLNIGSTIVNKNVPQNINELHGMNIMSAESAGKLGSVGSSFLSVQPTGSGGNSGLGGSSSPHFGGEREKNNYGSFQNSSVYLELFAQLNRTSTSAILSLNFDQDTEDKFHSFIKSVIHSMSVFVVQFGSQIRPYCSTIMKYLELLIPIAPNEIVSCITNMVKVSFVSSGTTIETNVGISVVTEKVDRFEQIFVSTEHFMKKPDRTQLSNAVMDFNTSAQNKPPMPKSPADKLNNQRLLRIFEKSVMEFMHKYCLSSDIVFQKSVLTLLIHLITLRVNYSLLDQDRVFLNFLSKQFELIACGYIRQGHLLLQAIMRLFSHLMHDATKINSKISVETLYGMVKRLADHSLTANSFSQTQYFSQNTAAGLSGFAVQCFSYPMVEKHNQKPMCSLSKIQKQIFSLQLQFLNYPCTIYSLTVMLKNANNHSQTWWEVLSLEIFSGLNKQLKTSIISLNECYIESPFLFLQSLYDLIDCLSDHVIDPDAVVSSIMCLNDQDNHHSVALALLLLLRLLVRGNKKCEGYEECGTHVCDLLDSSLRTNSSPDIQSLVYHIFLSFSHLCSVFPEFSVASDTLFNKDSFLPTVLQLSNVSPVLSLSCFNLSSKNVLGEKNPSSKKLCQDSPYRMVWCRGLLVLYLQCQKSVDDLNESFILSCVQSLPPIVVINELISLMVVPKFKDCLDTENIVSRLKKVLLLHGSSTDVVLNSPESHDDFRNQDIHDLFKTLLLNFCSISTDKAANTLLLYSMFYPAPEKMAGLTLVEVFVKTPFFHVKRMCQRLLFEFIDLILSGKNQKAQELEADKETLREIIDFLTKVSLSSGKRAKMLLERVSEKSAAFLNTNCTEEAKFSFPDDPNEFTEEKFLHFIEGLTEKKFTNVRHSRSTLISILDFVQPKVILKLMNSVNVHPSYLGIFVEVLLHSSCTGDEHIDQLQIFLKNYLEKTEMSKDAFVIAVSIIKFEDYALQSSIPASRHLFNVLQRDKKWKTIRLKFNLDLLNFAIVNKNNLTSVDYITCLRLLVMLPLSDADKDNWETLVNFVLQLYLNKFEPLIILPISLTKDSEVDPESNKAKEEGESSNDNDTSTDCYQEVDENAPKHPLVARKLCFLLHDMASNTKIESLSTKPLLVAFKNAVVRLSQLAVEDVLDHMRCLLRQNHNHDAVQCMLRSDPYYSNESNYQDPLVVASFVKYTRLLGCHSANTFNVTWKSLMSGLKLTLNEPEDVVISTLVIRGLVGILYDRVDASKYTKTVHRNTRRKPWWILSDKEVNTSMYFQSCAAIRREISNALSNLNDVPDGIGGYLSSKYHHVNLSFSSQEIEDSFVDEFSKLDIDLLQAPHGNNDDDDDDDDSDTLNFEGLPSQEPTNNKSDINKEREEEEEEKEKEINNNEEREGKSDNKQELEDSNEEFSHEEEKEEENKKEGGGEKGGSNQNFDKEQEPIDNEVALTHDKKEEREEMVEERHDLNEISNVVLQGGKKEEPKEEKKVTPATSDIQVLVDVPSQCNDDDNVNVDHDVNQEMMKRGVSHEFLSSVNELEAEELPLFIGGEVIAESMPTDDVNDDDDDPLKYIFKQATTSTSSRKMLLRKRGSFRKGKIGATGRTLRRPPAERSHSMLLLAHNNVDSDTLCYNEDNEVTSEDELVKLTLHENDQNLNNRDYLDCASQLLNFFKSYMYEIPRSQQSPMLLSMMTKAVLILTDITPNTNLFEWVLESFTHLYRMYSDALNFLPYLIPGLCRAASFLNQIPNHKIENAFIIGILEHNLNMSLNDMSVKQEQPQYPVPMFNMQQNKESNFQSQFVSVSAQIAVLQGCLCLLETESTQKLIIPLLNTFHRYFTKIFQTSDPSGEHRLYFASISAIVTLMDTFPKESLECGFKDFPQLFIEIACDKRTSKLTYHCILQGLEQLILKSPTLRTDLYLDVFKLLKRVDMNTSKRAFSALALMLTSMFAVHEDENIDSTTTTEERISSLLYRINRGFVVESQLYTHILPTLLCSFFETQQIMSSIMGEFLSCTKESGPPLSNVIFSVFQKLRSGELKEAKSTTLLSADQQEESHLKVICNWIVLSLNSFIQKHSPQMAMLCLSILFVSVSSRTWILNLYPYVKQFFEIPEQFPENLFVISTVDFFENQALDSTNQEIFLHVFEGSQDETFKLLSTRLKAIAASSENIS